MTDTTDRCEHCIQYCKDQRAALDEAEPCRYCCAAFACIKHVPSPACGHSIIRWDGDYRRYEQAINGQWHVAEQS